MTTIILTIIGILLAAAAALMVIFYGGDAFNSGSIGAQANTLQNAGTNVISAVQLYKAEKATAPIKLSDLTEAGPNGAYLKEKPALPEGLREDYSNIATKYEVSGVSTAVCDRVNKNLKVDLNGPDDIAGNADDATATNVKMGCFNGTFVANL